MTNDLTMILIHDSDQMVLFYPTDNVRTGKLNETFSLSDSIIHLANLRRRYHLNSKHFSDCRQHLINSQINKYQKKTLQTF